MHKKKLIIIYNTNSIPSNKGIEELDNVGEYWLLEALSINDSSAEKSDLYLASSANFLACSRVSIHLKTKQIIT